MDKVCAECGGPLSKKQMQAGGRFCSRSCAGKFGNRVRGVNAGNLNPDGTAVGSGEVRSGLGRIVQDPPPEPGDVPPSPLPQNPQQQGPIPFPPPGFTQPPPPPQQQPFVPPASPRHPDKHVRVPFNVTLTGQAANALEKLIQEGHAATESEAISQGLAALNAMYHQGQVSQYPYQQPGQQQQQGQQTSQPQSPQGQSFVAQMRVQRLQDMKLQMEEMALQNMYNQMMQQQQQMSTGLSQNQNQNAQPLPTEPVKKKESIRDLLHDLAEMKALDKMTGSGGESQDNKSVQLLREQISKLEERLFRQQEESKMQHTIDGLEGKFTDIKRSIDTKYQPDPQQMNMQQWTLQQMANKDDKMMELANQTQEARMQTLQGQTQTLIGQLAGQMQNMQNQIAQGNAAPQQGGMQALATQIQSLQEINRALGVVQGEKTEADAIVEVGETVCKTLKPVVDQVGSSIAKRLDTETQQAALKRRHIDQLELEARQHEIVHGLEQKGVPIQPAEPAPQPGAGGAKRAAPSKQSKPVKPHGL